MSEGRFIRVGFTCVVGRGPTVVQVFNTHVVGFRVELFLRWTNANDARLTRIADDGEQLLASNDGRMGRLPDSERIHALFVVTARRNQNTYDIIIIIMITIIIIITVIYYHRHRRRYSDACATTAAADPRVRSTGRVVGRNGCTAAITEHACAREHSLARAPLRTRTTPLAAAPNYAWRIWPNITAYRGRDNTS